MFIYLFLFDCQYHRTSIHERVTRGVRVRVRTVNAMYMYTVFPSSSISFPLSPPLVPTFGALCFGSRSLFRALTTSRSPLHFCTNTRAFIINVQRRITIFTQHRWSPTRTQRAMRLQRNDLCTETKCYLSVYARSARKRKRKGQKGRKG